MTVPTRSDDELAALLRRTYAAVATRTTVEPTVPDGDARLVADDADDATRWRSIAAAAAIVLATVGGLLTLVGRDSDAPAAPDAPRHVAIGGVPMLGEEHGYRRFALTELVSTATYDRLVYAVDDASITLEVGALDALPGGDTVITRGTTARRDDDALHWYGPSGRVVSLSWTGDVDPATIAEITRSTVYLDDAAWTTLTAHGGFRPDDDPLVTWRIEADVDFDVELRGDLHEGLLLWSGPAGLPIRIDDCLANTNDQTTEYPADPETDPTAGTTGYEIVVPGRADRAVVAVEGRPQRTVELTSLAPVVDLSVGGAVYEGVDPSSELPEVLCEGAGS